MKKNGFLALAALLLITAQSSLRAQTADQDCDTNCFSIIAGKKATADGSVLFGHNEDDGGMQMLNMNVGKGGIWAELPGMSVSDSFMNSCGVCIASDGCQSREDRNDFTDGGVVYEVRLHVWQHARTAREAVHLIARDVETYGYRGSGRTYMVADPDEGWLVSVVKGRHWVAARVPDNMVASIPNYYTIGKVNLADTLNYLGSKDLIEYAKSRGWYDPARDGEFSFRYAYGKASTLTSSHNVPRHKAVLEALGHSYNVDDVPFAVRCSRKIDLPMMRSLLGSHSEAHEDGSHPRCVCAHDTVLSAIFQLRSFMPREVGCVMWACPGKVCAEVHLPWYLGMSEAPQGFQRFSGAEEAIQKHFSDGNEPVDGKTLRERYPGGLYWHYVDRWAALEADYAGQIAARSRKVNAMQKKVFKAQASVEKKLLRLSPAEAAAQMNAYTAELVKETVD